MSSIWESFSLDNAFWKFSIDRYGRGDFSATCLNLQKEYGIDINLLLYGFWLGDTGKTIRDAITADEIIAKISDWRGNVIAPLRQSREGFIPVKDTPAGTTDPIRNAIKDLELRAEQVEQAVLFELSGAVNFESSSDQKQAMIDNVRILLPVLDQCQGEICRLACLAI